MKDGELYTKGDKLKCILTELYFVTKGKEYIIRGIHKDDLVISSDLGMDVILQTKHFDIDSYIRNKRISKILE